MIIALFSFPRFVSDYNLGGIIAVAHAVGHFAHAALHGMYNLGGIIVLRVDQVARS